MERYKILLGTTKNNELIFGNVGFRDWNGYPEFSASFDTVEPRILDEDEVKERIEGQIDCGDAQYKLNLLEHYDCAPSELADRMFEDSGDLIEDFYDNSLYPERFEIEDNTVFFESVGAGQHDTRNEVDKLFVSQEFYDYIHELWDECHLKEVSEQCHNKFIDLLEDNVLEEEEIIEEWLKEVLDI